MPNRVSFEQRDRVVLLTLDSPDFDNSIDTELAQDFIDACRRIGENDDIYVVVVTGSGKTFCAGSRLERTVSSGTSIGKAVSQLKEDAGRYEISSALSLVDRPVIAALNGDALGQGFELALACDIRIAVQGARLGFPSIASGLMPMDGGTQRLPRLVGKAKALELMLSGRTIQAEEALALGLVSEIVHGSELVDKALAMAQAMAAKAPISLRYVKEAVNKGMDLTLEQGIRLEADLYFLIHTTEDRTEGIRAFQQKRKPTFKGK